MNEKIDHNYQQGNILALYTQGLCISSTKAEGESELQLGLFSQGFLYVCG